MTFWGVLLTVDRLKTMPPDAWRAHWDKTIVKLNNPAAAEWAGVRELVAQIVVWLLHHATPAQLATLDARADLAPLLRDADPELRRAVIAVLHRVMAPPGENANA